jgi:hypothetical protein
MTEYIGIRRCRFCGNSFNKDPILVSSEDSEGIGYFCKKSCKRSYEKKMKKKLKKIEKRKKLREK